jgi:rhodanese-related sulfurtransferase
LLERLSRGEEILIVDLRQPFDVEALPYRIPGAVRIAMEELEKRHQEIPRDREIVLYCS